MFWARPEAYPRVEHLKNIGFSGKHKTRLKRLAGTNTLAYNENSLLTVVKSFITLAPEQLSTHQVMH